MQIRARMSISADGYVTTPDGWPAQLADPAFVSGKSHGIREFLEGCEAALMGRTTFEPALTNDRWPWPNLAVFVLASHRPSGTPEHVIVDGDPLGEEIDALLKELNGSWRAGRHRPARRPAQTKTVRVSGGTPGITDGPLADAQEHFGGYLIVDCESIERAVEIAARWPSSRFAPLEVRPIVDIGGVEMRARL